MANTPELSIESHPDCQTSQIVAIHPSVVVFSLVLVLVAMVTVDCQPRGNRIYSKLFARMKTLLYYYYVLPIRGARSLETPRILFGPHDH